MAAHGQQVAKRILWMIDGSAHVGEIPVVLKVKKSHKLI
jgi:hypothetical protein